MWAVKDIGTPNMKMRILPLELGIEQYIVNGAQKKAWKFGGDTNWQFVEVSYEEQWNYWYSKWQGYWAKLEPWVNGDHLTKYNILASGGLDYKVPGGIMKISGPPQVIGLIPDSSFLPYD
jgi:hypothetical protein